MYGAKWSGACGEASMSLSTLATPIAALIVAPFIGSFLGVLIRRLPRGQPLAWVRSACDACGHVLGPAELIPLLSFAALRGSCRHCHAPIARFHPLIELAAILVPLSCLAAGIDGPATVWPGCALGWTLLALGWIDWETTLLPDILTLPLLVAGLAWCLWSAPDQLAGHAAASIAAYLAFRLISVLYRRLRSRDGLGEGDAKLFAAGAAWTGLPALPHILLAAALTGLLAAALLRLSGRTVGLATRIPFGPPLALAIWSVWLLQTRPPI
jgi:leader peptidase (prepilin peptidase)/N-methyltransferase